MAEFQEEEFPGNVELEDGRSFFLVRLPKNINLSQLNNVRIKKLKASNDIDVLKSEGSKYSLKVGPDVGLSNFRPIVRVDDKAVAGPKFAGCLTITREVVLQQAEDDVPSNAYKFKPQVRNLRLPTPPIGSASSKEDLHKRLESRSQVSEDNKGASKSSSLSKKRHAEEMKEADGDASGQTAVEDKSSKKKKKEKSR